MIVGSLEGIPDTEKKTLEAALAGVNVVDALGKAIRVRREEVRTYEALLRQSAEKAVRAPEGNLFIIKSALNSFEVSTWGRQPSQLQDWSTPHGFPTKGEVKQFELGEPNPAYVARMITTNPADSHNAGVAYAYSPFTEERCRLEDHHVVDLIPEDQLPELLVNLRPEPEVAQTT